MDIYGKKYIKDELFTGHKPIPIKIANKIMNSICKITVEINGKISSGTGFFMNISDKLKYLITNYHIINPKLINVNIEIEIWNNKKIKLNLHNRIIKYSQKPIDISAIEIKNSDEIYNYVECLGYDRNYIIGYTQYINADVFSIEHPNGYDASCASGIVLKVNNFEFDHNIPTDNGSSGCPILLLSNNINLVKVIGIHKNSDYKNKVNGGTFIGELIRNINNDNGFNNISYNNNNIFPENDPNNFSQNNMINNNNIINTFEQQNPSMNLNNTSPNEDSKLKIIQILILLYANEREVTNLFLQGYITNPEANNIKDYYIVNKSLIDKFKQIYH